MPDEYWACDRCEQHFKVSRIAGDKYILTIQRPTGGDTVYWLCQPCWYAVDAILRRLPRPD